MPNLNEMSNEEREEYRRKVSEAIGLDPEMWLLDFIWMPSEDGMKNLVLYCRRGAAEILRANRGISITKMVKEDGSGYVSFTSEGVDKTGRTEIAVGSASIEGLKGEKLAHAVMTASTRSLRRLTLQFTQYGLLDESEVNPQVANIATSGASLAQLAGSPTVMPPPQVAPSTAPGKDITESAKSQVETPASDSSLWCLDCKQSLSDHLLVNSERVCPKVGNAVPNIPQTSDKPEPKRRGRRRRNSVDIASPGQQTETPVGHIDVNGTITPISVPPATAKEPEQGVNGNSNVAIPALAEPVKKEKTFPGIDPLPQPTQVIPARPTTLGTAAVPPISVFPINTTQTMVAPTNSSSVPTQVNSAPTAQDPVAKAKFEEYRMRLRKYSNDILPAGGMMSTEGLGGVTMKLRHFTKQFAGVDDTAKLTEQHWEDLFDFLDSYTAKNGPQGLVQYIDKQLGVVK